MAREEPSRQQEVQRLLDLLRSKVIEERLKAARQLKEIGVRTRGGRTRGVVSKPASKPIEALDLTPAMEAIKDAHWEVRREVALALGEWGDEVAVKVLEHLARQDPDWEVRSAVAQALANIGGPRAVEVLKYMATTDPDPRARKAAVEGLAGLALTTWPEFCPRGAVRTRGAVRIRGARPSKRVSPEADAILKLLDDLRFQDSSSIVRDAAEGALAQLDE
jgi:HEAT repeat protein